MRVQTGRSMRAFRIVRLFRRVKSLRNIVMALTSSIVPVINAYFVLLVAMCICVYHPASFISFYFLSFYFLSHAALFFRFHHGRDFLQQRLPRVLCCFRPQPHHHVPHHLGRALGRHPTSHRRDRRPQLGKLPLHSLLPRYRLLDASSGPARRQVAISSESKQNRERFGQEIFIWGKHETSAVVKSVARRL